MLGTADRGWIPDMMQSMSLLHLIDNPRVVQCASRLLASGSQTAVTQESLDGEAARPGHGSHPRRTCGCVDVTNADSQFTYWTAFIWNDRRLEAERHTDEGKGGRDNAWKRGRNCFSSAHCLLTMTTTSLLHGRRCWAQNPIGSTQKRYDVKGLSIVARMSDN